MIENYFSTSFLDRVSERRRDEQWIKAKLEDDNSQFIAIFEEKNLFTLNETPQPIYLSITDLKKDNIPIDSIILLGVIGYNTYFAVDLNGFNNHAAFEREILGKFIDLKKTAAL